MGYTWVVTAGAVATEVYAGNSFLHMVRAVRSARRMNYMVIKISWRP